MDDYRVAAGDFLTVVSCFSPVVLGLSPVIPAKAGIHRARGRAIWERGRPARNAALARVDTLILAFSHKGRRDPLAVICT